MEAGMSQPDLIDDLLSTTVTVGAAAAAAAAAPVCGGDTVMSQPFAC